MDQQEKKIGVLRPLMQDEEDNHTVKEWVLMPTTNRTAR
jgi:hypothetical protein